MLARARLRAATLTAALCVRRAAQLQDVSLRFEEEPSMSFMRSVAAHLLEHEEDGRSAVSLARADTSPVVTQGAPAGRAGGAAPAGLASLATTSQPQRQ